MKIRFKINRTQLTVWHTFLESRWIEPNYSSVWSILIHHALSELLHKLKTEALIKKPKYGFSVSSVSCLAFMIFCEFAQTFSMDETDKVILNEIIGTIDNKIKNQKL